VAHDYLVIIDDSHAAAFQAWLSRYRLELVPVDSRTSMPMYGIRTSTEAALTGVGHPDNERRPDPLLALRMEAGVSQARAAVVLGIGPQAINAIEHSRAEISPAQRKTLEAFYEAVRNGEITR
jgi:hypothetical protein